jgi:hypothetical protein
VALAFRYIVKVRWCNFHPLLEEALRAGITRVNYSGEQIKKTLDQIYDAAAENEFWHDVLTAIADLTNSQGAVLLPPPRKQKWWITFPPTLFELRRTSR